MFSTNLEFESKDYNGCYLKVKIKVDLLDEVPDVLGQSQAKEIFM